MIIGMLFSPERYETTPFHNKQTSGSNKKQPSVVC